MLKSGLVFKLLDQLLLHLLGQLTPAIESKSRIVEQDWALDAAYSALLVSAGITSSCLHSNPVYKPQDVFTVDHIRPFSFSPIHLVKSENRRVYLHGCLSELFYLLTRKTIIKFCVLCTILISYLLNL